MSTETVSAIPRKRRRQLVICADVSNVRVVLNSMQSDPAFNNFRCPVVFGAFFWRIWAFENISMFCFAHH